MLSAPGGHSPTWSPQGQPLPLPPCGLSAVRSQLELGLGVSGDVDRSSGLLRSASLPPHILELSQTRPCWMEQLVWISAFLPSWDFMNLLLCLHQNLGMCLPVCLSPFKMPLTGRPL